MAKQEFYMKHLIPGGHGTWYVVRFVGETPEDIANVRNELLSEADWGDASQMEYDAFCAALNGVWRLFGKDWSKLGELADSSQQKIMQDALQAALDLVPNGDEPMVVPGSETPEQSPEASSEAAE